MNVETGVLMSGGLSTSLWPAGTAIPKGLMPVYIGEEGSPDAEAVPVGHFAALEFAEAGIQRAITITPEWGPEQLRGHFVDDLPEGMVTTAALLHKDADVAVEQRRRRDGYDGMAFEFIVQPSKTADETDDQPEQPYGTAFALSLAQVALEGEERFILRNADDILVTRQGETSELADAITAWEESGADHFIMGFPMERERSSSVGVLLPGADGMLGGFAEKPKPHELPADMRKILGNIGIYGFSSKIWGPLEEEMGTPREAGEHLLTDVIEAALAVGQTFHIHRVDRTKTHRFDGGKPYGLLAASIFLTNNVSYRPTR
jgi:UTP-glucose-1-phosphate uridylyltransferase